MLEKYDKQTGFPLPNEEQGDSSEEASSPESDKDAADETTGASPGTAQACNDLGLNSLEENLKRLGIKRPGE
jgi:hypothetical protein